MYNAMLTRTRAATALTCLTLSLSACGPRADQAAISSAASASAAAFPAGNEGEPMTQRDCDQLPDPPTSDDSAAARAVAVSKGQAARAACNKDVAALREGQNGDLARIRQIKEGEEAERRSRERSEQAWKRGLKDASGQPIKDYKY